MFKFSKAYFILAVLLFIAELFIGLYMHDALIRPYGGDFLIVIFLYCLVKSFFDTPVLMTAFWVLIFAYAVEVSQYFHLVTLLGLEHSRAAKMLLGTYFSFIDLLWYTLGILMVMLTENLKISLKKF